MRELEKKLNKIGDTSTADSNQQEGDKGEGGAAPLDDEMSKNLNSDKVMRNLASLIKRLKQEKQDAVTLQKKIEKDLKIFTQEIESYNKQLIDLDAKEKEQLPNMGAT